MAGGSYRGDRMWCYARSRELRDKGFSWPQVVAVLALDCPATPLRLYRLAHGRSAAEVVDEVNRRDPAGTATLRVQRLYDYEVWPKGGRRPSLLVLPVLAEMYQTAARLLVGDGSYLGYPPRDRDAIDAADFCHLDRNHSRRLSAMYGSSNHPTAWGTASGTAWDVGPPGHEGSLRRPGREELGRDAIEPLTAPVPDDSLELFRAVTRLEPDPQRQEVLFQLALLVGGTAGLPVLRELTDGERERLAWVARSPHLVDAKTASIFEKITARCRRLDDQRGPRAVYRAALGCQSLVRRMLDEGIRTPVGDRLLRVYGELSQLVGWLLYDLEDYATAERYFKNGLGAAQQAKDVRMTAFIHSCLVHMANYRGQVPAALDHVFAARGWAGRANSARLRTWVELMAAWAFANDGQELAFGRCVDWAHQLISDRPGADDPDYLYVVDRGFSTGLEAHCNLLLNRPAAAFRAIDESFKWTAPDNTKNWGFRLAGRTEGLVHQKEIDEAALTASRLAEIAAGLGSVRLTQLLHDLRRQMQPWAGTSCVKDLDERLVELGWKEEG